MGEGCRYLYPFDVMIVCRYYLTVFIQLLSSMLYLFITNIVTNCTSIFVLFSHFSLDQLEVSSARISSSGTRTESGIRERRPSCRDIYLNVSEAKRKRVCLLGLAWLGLLAGCRNLKKKIVHVREMQTKEKRNKHVASGDAWICCFCPDLFLPRSSPVE